MAELNLTKENFKSEVLDSEVPVLVDFWAPWCGPCQAMAPVIEELAGEIKGAKVTKLNVDDNTELAQEYDIHSIPTFIIFKGGQVAEQFSGALSKDGLREKLDQHK